MRFRRIDPHHPPCATLNQRDRLPTSPASEVHDEQPLERGQQRTDGRLLHLVVQARAGGAQLLVAGVEHGIVVHVLPVHDLSPNDSSRQSCP